MFFHLFWPKIVLISMFGPYVNEISKFPQFYRPIGLEGRAFWLPSTMVANFTFLT